MAASERRSFILHVVASVTVGGEEILIELRRTALRHALVGETSSMDAACALGFQAGTPDAGDELSLRVTARLNRTSKLARRENVCKAVDNAERPRSLGPARAAARRQGPRTAAKRTGSSNPARK